MLYAARRQKAAQLVLTFLRDLDHASTLVLAIRQLQHKRAARWWLLLAELSCAACLMASQLDACLSLL